MPIFEYHCNACGTEFELLVRSATVPACEKCGGTDLRKLLSLPAIQSETTHALAMRAARRRDRAQGTEREAAQAEYERNHDD
ncbi:MAG TPA: zinc ribbon domain-containing protein [Gemmatimonadaceae bacterium]|nr:zinc ribbon domain-containing protein [Gemmatimonadaceae bacterium]